MAKNIQIPENHPRFLSLMTREKLVSGFRNGYVALEGLIAQGRGESFDYLLGEHTIESAKHSIDAASALFLLAKHPVISVNGNSIALCAKEICALNSLLEKSIIEINLFYFTKKREKLISAEIKKHGVSKILGINNKDLVEIPELKSNRRFVDKDGIFKADVVFVPLEDGDRTIALKKMNKKVITVDLNPLSRTALTSDITIVDNIVRVIPQLIERIEYHKKNSNTSKLNEIIQTFDNKEGLRKALDTMRSNQVSNI